MVAAIGEVVVRQMVEGRDHGEAELSAMDLIERFGPLHDGANQIEAERGFAALKLDGERGRGRFEDPVESRIGVFEAHVETGRVHRRARHLTILAAVIAAQRHHEDMKGRPVQGEGFSRGVGGAFQIAPMLARRVMKQGARLEVCVARVSEKEGVSRQGLVLGSRQHRVVAEIIGDQHPTPFSV
ncbi:hypothetical protein D3C72_1445720 [compost metagenome]